MKRMLISLAMLGCLTGTAPAQLGQEPNQPLQSQDVGRTAQPYQPTQGGATRVPPGPPAYQPIQPEQRETGMENPYAESTEGTATHIFFIIGGLTVVGVLAAYAVSNARSGGLQSPVARVNVGRT